MNIDGKGKQGFVGIFGPRRRGYQHRREEAKEKSGSHGAKADRAGPDYLSI
jgi:hypothetical protein